MLAALVVVGRAQWTPEGPFGIANAITAARLCLLAAFPIAVEWGAEAVIGLSLLFLLADLLDGRMARRRGQTSAFGVFFDKEVDALFLLVLCFAAVIQGRLPLWILGVGLLRYGFVVVLFLLNPPEKTEQRSTLARYIYGGMVAALLLSFLLYPALYRPVVGVAAGALVVSFGRSLWRIVFGGAAFGRS